MVVPESATIYVSVGLALTISVFPATFILSQAKLHSYIFPEYKSPQNTSSLVFPGAIYFWLNPPKISLLSSFYL